MKKLLFVCLAILTAFSFSQVSEAYSFSISTDPYGTGDPAKAQFDILNDGTNEITFTLKVLEPQEADLRGVYFNITEGTLSNFNIVGEHITTFATGTEIVTAGQPSSSINPVAPDGSFDVGVEIGSQGIGSDDIFETSFILKNDFALTLGDVFGVRLMSVTIDDPEDPRGGSSKLIGYYDPSEEPPAPVPEPGSALLLGLGIIGLLGFIKKQKQK